MQRQEFVKLQYANADRLSVRMAFQQRYSANAYGFSRWLMDQYDFQPGARVLELGCGTGALWQGRATRADDFSRLTLTDISEGMLAKARENLPGLRAEYAQADIQSLPFADASFDWVIANMMLYHVPDKRKALSEVRRTLTPGGVFACATYGETGVPSYMRALLLGIADIRMPDTSFTLQSGEALLHEQFSQVERRDYPDHFELTDPRAVIEYLLSMTGVLIDPEAEFPVEAATREVERRMRKEGGCLRIPKEYGTFLCR